MAKYIVGTSTLSEIIIEVLAEANQKIEGFFDDFNKDKIFMNTPIIGTVNDIIIDKKKYLNDFFFVSIGDNKSREKIISSLKNTGFRFFNVIHKKSYIDKSVNVGTGNYIGPFVYIGTKSKIGDGNIIFKGVAINHHNKVGNYCFFSPNSSIGGYTIIGDRVKIGMNSVVNPYIEIKNDFTSAPLTLIKD